MLLECCFVFICVLFLFSCLFEAANLNSVEKMTFCLAAPPINAKNAKINKLHGFSNFIS